MSKANFKGFCGVYRKEYDFAEKKILSLHFILVSVFVVEITAQNSQPPTKQVDFGYSRNPKTKSKSSVRENNSKETQAVTPESNSASAGTFANTPNLISENKTEVAREPVS